MREANSDHYGGIYFGSDFEFRDGLLTNMKHNHITSKQITVVTVNETIDSDQKLQILGLFDVKHKYYISEIRV